MKKVFIYLSVFLTFNSCAELQTVMNQLPSTPSHQSGVDVSSGLKQALEFGVVEGVNTLSQTNGFFNDNVTRILLPKELQQVDKTLRQIGLSSLADEGLKVLNSAAEDAVKEAKPIFISAIKNISFGDAMNILMGDDLSATRYLQTQTSNQLVRAFEPKIKNSLDKVGANKIWSDIIEQYNSVPFVSPVNPNLTEYVTEQAVKGLFTKVGVKEKEIRNNIGARTTALLQSVFAMQD